MAAFEKGDRVIATGLVAGLDLADMTGTIIINGHNRIAIEFDEPFPLGHSCDGRCKNGHGRWADARNPGVELLESSAICSYEDFEILEILENKIMIS